MFALTRSERLRRTFMRQVLGLFRQKFHDEVADKGSLDQVWNDWLALERRGVPDLIHLLVSDVRPVYKARALVVLLAPRPDYIPFAWTGEVLSTTGRLYRVNIPFAQLPITLHWFAAELVKTCVDAVLELNDHWDKMILSDYNQVILGLLQQNKLERNQVLELFGRFQLNDPVPFSNMDEASGYTPFRDLLFDLAVPEDLKCLADEKMRQIILSEEEGQAKPRQDWEEARYCYLDHIELCLVCETFPYSEDLFASQIEFLLNLSYKPGGRFFASRRLHKILTMLGGEDRKELRNTFARWMILCDRGPIGNFRIGNDEDLKGAKMVLAEFGESDVLLGEVLKSLIADKKRSFVENQRSARSLAERRGAVMEQMR